MLSFAMLKHAKRTYPKFPVKNSRNPYPKADFVTHKETFIMQLSLVRLWRMHTWLCPIMWIFTRWLSHLKFSFTSVHYRKGFLGILSPLPTLSVAVVAFRYPVERKCSGLLQHIPLGQTSIRQNYATTFGRFRLRSQHKIGRQLTHST